MSSKLILQAAQRLNSERWFNLNWKNDYRKVRFLRNRIVKSVRNGEWCKAKRVCFFLIQYIKSKHVLGASIYLGVCNA
jgi:hypothetical protein